MTTQFQSTDDVQEWCCDLPLTGERRMTDDEERTLREEASRFGRRAWSWGCAAPIFLIFTLACAGAASDLLRHSAAAQGFLGVLLALCLLLFPAIFLLRANDFGRRRSYAKKDLKAGRIKIYQAIPAELWDYAPPAEDAEHDDENLPMQLGGIEVSPRESVTLEVFAASRRLWSVNGQRAHGLTELPAVQVATVPSQARTSAAWAQPAVKLAEGHYDISNATRRDLSSGERDELRRSIRKGWMRPALAAVPLTTLFIIAPLLYWLNEMPMTIEPSAYFFFALTLWCDYIFFQRALLARRWARDARDGFTYVFQMPPDSAISGESDTLLELLPHSQSLWTVNGKPAPWRLNSR